MELGPIDARRVSCGDGYHPQSAPTPRRLIVPRFGRPLARMDHPRSEAQMTASYWSNVSVFMAAPSDMRDGPTTRTGNSFTTSYNTGPGSFASTPSRG